jgi:O-antigen ligase
MLLRDRRDLVTAMLCWALSATVNGLGALGQITGISMIAGPLEAHRATGFTGHPNDLGGAVAVALVPVLTLAVRVPSRLGVMRVLKWIMLVVTAAALIVSGSVGGIVAAVLAGILWVTNPALGGRARMAIVLGLAAALLVTSTIGGTVTSPEKRFLQVVGRPGSAPNAGSAQSRIDVIIGAWPRIRQNPFIGTGMGNNNLGVPLLSNGVVQVDQVHNAFVAAWYETGIIGLAGLLLVLGAVLSLGWQAVLTARDRADRILGWALVCAFVAYIVYAMSAPLYFQQYGWFAGALVVACGVRGVERPVSVARRQDLWRQPELASP